MLCRRLFLASLLLTAIPSFAQITSVTFEPGRIDSHTPVIAHTRGLAGYACRGTSDVKINGTHIDLNINCSGGGIAVPSAWGADAFIGTLAAGTYDVVVSAGGEHRTLVVEDADAGFSFSPKEGASNSSTLIVFDSHSPLPAAVSVGGVPAKKVGLWSFLAPPHRAGAVDVTLFADYGGPTLTAKNAFRYYDDEHDPTVFEPVLFPIIFNGAGAYGSQWVTEASAQLLNGDTIAIEGSHPHGYLYFASPDAAKQMAFNSRIRDISRQAESFGTEIPVIRREQFRGPLFTILDVPHDPRYRVTVRLYSLDPTTIANIGVSTMSGDPLFSFVPKIVPPASPTEPAYAEVNLDALLATPPTATRVRLDFVSPIRNSEKLYWAFVTVTNNETQDVTTLTPQ